MEADCDRGRRCRSLCRLDYWLEEALVVRILLLLLLLLLLLVLMWMDWRVNMVNMLGRLQTRRLMLLQARRLVVLLLLLVGLGRGCGTSARALGRARRWTSGVDDVSGRRWRQGVRVAEVRRRACARRGRVQSTRAALAAHTAERAVAVSRRVVNATATLLPATAGDNRSVTRGVGASIQERIAPVAQTVEKGGVCVVDAIHGRFE